MNKYCKLHNCILEEKISKTKGTKYMGHFDETNKTMCFGDSEEIPEGATTREKLPLEEKVDWDAKDRQSMAQTALKGATELQAALINGGFVTQPYTITDAITDVKNTANQLYNELKGMKAKG